MHTATTRFGLLAMLVLLASPAWAQEYQITFQVDMTDAITNCALDPESDQVISVAGELNDWTTGVDNLTDADGDNVYDGTFAVNEDQLGDDGVLQYKFWGTDPVGWEDDPNRTFDPTEDATLDPVAFNKTFTDLCTTGGEEETYELVFRVDMSVQISRGNFDPVTDVVTVAGDFNGFSNNADTLAALSSNPDIYTGLFQADVIVPSTQNYKYIIGEPEDAAPDGWESDSDRTFEITGDEEDANGNGIPEVLVPQRFFNDATPDDFLDAPATVTFNVDLRTAFQLLADSSQIPSNAQASDFVTSIDGLFINGLVAGKSTADELTDWADWGPDALGSIPTRELSDDDGDGIYTITYEYEEGTERNLPGKFGTDGYDNEAGEFNDHQFRIDPGTQTIDLVFGCMVKNDGTLEDDNGPGGIPYYDPYALIDLDATPQTCSFVESGGEADNAGTSVEGTGVVPATAELRGNFPNPFARATTFEYAIADAGHVSLTVYDLMGRRVATLVDGPQAADTYRVAFDASELASGVYIVRLMVGDTVQSKKLTVTN
jgi:hypothetical protein